jgi:hypothetical protein
LLYRESAGAHRFFSRPKAGDFRMTDFNADCHFEARNKRYLSCYGLFSAPKNLLADGRRPG